MITEKELKVLQLRSTGLTQVEVARKLGISQAAISSFEKSGIRKLEDAELVLQLAKKLNIQKTSELSGRRKRNSVFFVNVKNRTTK